ncbi:MAG: RNA polymerase sigma factor [Eubacterium sp.]|nr:RNA polymerase sigma factor [Eubacterium sp.]MCM1302923.1 RNA polymerase sigma factor [Butyrivibrio sp.]MCM1342995.1 RNA polymerase sigma factor [Muribaculaceae bacterium]MCM1410725.1 RNA polymerase sigma factor [Lachnospiraceae bacterium]
MQDYELIKRIRQGEKQLFGQLVEKYYDDVFRYCYYQTGSEHTAYDCTQETFYHLMRFLDNYRERNHFKAYLIRIASNVCRDYFRKSSRRTVREVSYSQWEDPAEPPQKPAETPPLTPGAEQEALLRLSVREGLMRLPESQREVIVLYYYQGYKLREIASLTGVPLSTVKTRLYAGTEKLKEYLKEEI